MSRNVLLISLILILWLIGAVWWLSGGQTSGKAAFDPTKIVFFYSTTCTHCQATEAWFEEQKISEKIQFDRKEISTPAVQAELQQATDYCKFDTSQGVGVPFLFAEGKCYMGSPDVEGYFKQKLELP